LDCDTMPSFQVRMTAWGRIAMRGRLGDAEAFHCLSDIVEAATVGVMLVMVMVMVMAGKGGTPVVVSNLPPLYVEEG